LHLLQSASAQGHKFLRSQPMTGRTTTSVWTFLPSQTQLWVYSCPQLCARTTPLSCSRSLWTNGTVCVLPRAPRDWTRTSRR